MNLKEFFIKNKAYVIFFFVLLFSGCVHYFINSMIATVACKCGPCDDGITVILLPFAYLIHGTICSVLLIYFIYFLILLAIGFLIIFLIKKRNTFGKILVVIIFSMIIGGLVYSWQNSRTVLMGIPSKVKENNDVSANKDEQKKDNSGNESGDSVVEPNDSENDNRMRRASAEEKVKPAPEKPEQIIKNKETGYFEYSLTETIDNYEIIQENGFDFIEIEIKGFEQMEGGSQTPVLPGKRFEIPLPKNAEIKEIIVERSNPINLGKLNIPATTNDDPPLATDKAVDYQYYIEASDSIGLFEEIYFNNFTAKDINYTKSIVDVAMATYNTASDEAILYKKISIKIIYETDQSVILLRASPEKRRYKRGEMMNTIVLLKNITDKKISVDIINKLDNRHSKSMATQNKIVEIAPIETKEVNISLEIPLTSEVGGYRVVTIVNHDQNKVGASSEYINVDY